jgi:hypothetical protein
MILPIDIEERIKIFSSLPYLIPNNIIDYFSNNRNIYCICGTPVMFLTYLVSEIGSIPYLRQKTCSVDIYPINKIIDKPFILYEIKDNYIRGFCTPDHENETIYRDYKNQYAIYREKRINKILEKK